MNNLIKIFSQLDNARLALHKNMTALDCDLEETFNNFLEEIKTLEILIGDLKNDCK